MHIYIIQAAHPPAKPTATCGSSTLPRAATAGGNYQCVVFDVFFYAVFDPASPLPSAAFLKYGFMHASVCGCVGVWVP